MKDDRLSTQEDRESHIREKVTNRVEPSNIDSRVGISPPSEPDVKVSPHPALCRGISTHCFP